MNNSQPEYGPPNSYVEDTIIDLKTGHEIAITWSDNIEMWFLDNYTLEATATCEYKTVQDAIAAIKNESEDICWVPYDG